MKVIDDKQQEALDSGTLLPIMEEFYTIQGEGLQSGKAAYFVRIGGCDVGCHWCDVKESWDPSMHPLSVVSLIVKNALKYPARVVVVTGGEPAMYNLNYFTDSFVENGFKTFIETSGAYALTGTWSWVCLSPKKTGPPIQENYGLADELKIIVHNKNDLAWAEENAKHVGDNCKLYIQPEWSKRKQVMPFMVDYVLENPKWNISLQTHKYMGIP